MCVSLNGGCLTKRFTATLNNKVTGNTEGNRRRESD